MLYEDQARLRQFLHAMTGLSMGAAQAIARRFPWQRYQTFVDLGQQKVVCQSSLRWRIRKFRSL